MHPLKAYRELQNPPLSQEDLAERLGVTRSAICRWESGERRPDSDLLLKITKLTGIPAARLRPDLAVLFKQQETAA